MTQLILDACEVGWIRTVYLLVAHLRTGASPFFLISRPRPIRVSCHSGPTFALGSGRAGYYGPHERVESSWLRSSFEEERGL